MGRKAAKKCKGYKSAPCAPQSPDISSALSSDCPLRDDIDDNFARIYESFFLEFEKRVGERKSQSDALLLSDMQRSTLDAGFRTRLVTKVQSLTRAIGLRGVVELLEGRTLDFIERLLLEVRTQQGDRLRLGLLEDAFDVMDNAVEVVENLVQNSRDNPQSVLRRAKVEFYRLVEEETVLAQVLDWGERTERERELYEERRYLSDLYSEEDQAYSEQLSAQSSVQSMSLEELVLYINEGQTSLRRGTTRSKSNQSTADCSESPQTEEDCEVDKEVEEFRRKLEEPRKRLGAMMKPRVSDEWLKRLSLSVHTALQSTA